MAQRDYYNILGLQRSASAEEIKKAYRRLARKYHPDTTGGDAQAAERFKELQETYEVLKDTKKRQMYDRFGHAGVKMSAGPAGYQDHAGQSGPFNWSQGGGGFDFNISDIFGGGGGMGDIFDQLRNQTGRRAPRSASAAKRGRDIEHKVRLGFYEAINGTTRDVVATVKQSNGQQRRERITVKIPPGVDNGSKIRVKGKGQPGMRGNDGDLIIKVEIEQHPYFRKEGSDIYLEVPVTFTEAALGAKIDVPTLSGTTKVTVPPGSSSGRKLRLRDKGIKKHHSDKHGDMFLELKVVPPADLDQESEQLLKELAQRNPQDDIRRDWQE